MRIGIVACVLGMLAGCAPARGGANQQVTIEPYSGGIADPILVDPWAALWVRAAPRQRWITDDDQAALWADYGSLSVYPGLAGEAEHAAMLEPAIMVPAPAGETPSRDAEAAFSRGYTEAGGPPWLLAKMIAVMACEGSWQADPGNPLYESTAQFAPSSWAEAGGGDPADFYQVGGNVARWIAVIGIENIATPGGWPVCGR